jgi:hypothetical protein
LAYQKSEPFFSESAEPNRYSCRKPDNGCLQKSNRAFRD